MNIAFANELAAYASRVGVDVLEAIRAANSQPYSHIHQPGLGVGGHCIPVYPHFLLSRAPEMELVGLSRRVNDGQVDDAVGRLRDELGGLQDVPVLVLGLTYREGVKELAYSRAVPLLERLAEEGARVEAWDPLLSATEIETLGAAAWTWASPSEARAIVTQTADPAFRRLDLGWFSGLQVILDGRNSLRDLAVPPGVRVLGMGVPPRGGAGPQPGRTPDATSLPARSRPEHRELLTVHAHLNREAIHLHIAGTATGVPDMDLIATIG